MKKFAIVKIHTFVNVSGIFSEDLVTLRLSSLQLPPRGRGILVLFVVRGHAIFRGTFLKPLRNHGYHFHSFFYFSRNYGCPFLGIFHHFRNYDLYVYSICEIMARKSTRIYGIMGTNFSGKWHVPVT